MRKIVLIFVFLLSGCTTNPIKENDKNSNQKTSELEQLLSNGQKMLNQRKRTKAITIFEQLNKKCSQEYNDPKLKIYTARTQAETLYYLILAASENKSASVINTVCSDTLYYLSYINLDLGKVKLAENYIKKAIDMSPLNSLYLSELGHIHHQKRDWQSALNIFQRSEKAAETHSPEQIKNSELSRAKRGMGFSLIELGQLNKAEEKFKECLEINSKDQKALQELEYIESLRKNDRK